MGCQVTFFSPSRLSLSGQENETVKRSRLSKGFRNVSTRSLTYMYFFFYCLFSISEKESVDASLRWERQSMAS